MPRGVHAALCAVLGFCLVLMAGGVTAGSDPHHDPAPFSDSLRGDSISKLVRLEQGWTREETVEFYTMPQGSRLLPYRMFLALEQPNSERKFSDPDYLSRFGYLPQPAYAENPDALPVGFVRDGSHLGLTCAACHTGQVHFRGVGVRIEGGQGMGDLDGLLHALNDALEQTIDDDLKFQRFAGALNADTSSEREALRGRLQSVYTERKRYTDRNDFAADGTVHPPWGLARVDAFGAILNQLLAKGLGIEENSRVADAPVSYPFLWDTPQHEFVEWNGIAANKDLFGVIEFGAMGRNVGEVLGVFGEIRIERPRFPSFPGYRSSARRRNLIELEKLVAKLWSPQWPESALPPIDRARSELGKGVYGKFCQACHALIDRTDPDREIEAVMIPVEDVGTDSKMALNYDRREASTGILEGVRSKFIFGRKYRARESGDELMRHIVAGAIIRPGKPLEESDLAEPESVMRGGAPEHLQEPAYKARPLNGIWATAPYLHNGSVASLYELLLPPAERLAEFHVGSRELDPVNVGLSTEPVPGSFRFRIFDDNGDSVPGNSNTGHLYGTGAVRSRGGDGLPALSENQRRDLIEFLKTL